MEKEIKNLQKLVTDGFKKVEERFVGLEDKIDTLAVASAKGFEEAEKDRNEIKSSLSRLELKVDNYQDQMTNRVGFIENKVGIDPTKPNKIIR